MKYFITDTLSLSLAADTSLVNSSIEYMFDTKWLIPILYKIIYGRRSLVTTLEISMGFKFLKLHNKLLHVSVWQISYNKNKAS